MSSEEHNDYDRIGKRRYATLFGAWERLRLRLVDFENVEIVDHLITATVAEYIQLREVFKREHNIRGRIQRPKVAGLMAVAVLRHRPLQLIDTLAPGLRPELSRDNEFFALYHGIAVVGENCSREQMAKFRNSEKYSDWWVTNVHSLHEVPRPLDAIKIFESIAMLYFPESLDQELE